MNQTNKHLFLFDLKKIKQKNKLIKIVDKSEDKKNIKDLSMILLKKHQKFAKKYRLFIWTKLLSIPQNSDSFKRLENNSKNILSPEVIRKSFKLMDNSLADGLHSVVNQLVFWRPELLIDCSVEDLSLFCFPFVKLFKSIAKPIVLFEVLATLLKNNFFLDKKLKETEMFSLIESILKVESKELLKHLNSLRVDIKTDICFPLLKTIFSEVFFKNDWLMICDHLFTYGPQLYHYLILSFILLSKQLLFRQKSREDIQSLFRCQKSMAANNCLQSANKLSQKYLQLSAFDFIPLTKNVY